LIGWLAIAVAMAVFDIICQIAFAIVIGLEVDNYLVLSHRK